MPSHPDSRSTSTTSDRGDVDDLRHATDVLGDRWLLLLLGALAGGPRRFGDLSDELSGVAPNVLTDRLRRAQRAGLITGRPYQQRPRRLAYDLTSAGRDAARFLPAMAAWSAQRRGATPASHSACGTTMQMRWWCPECNEPATPDIDGSTAANSPTSPTPSGDGRIVWV